MHIVLVGLPVGRMQHLAASLRQVLTPINPHLNFQTPELSPWWTASAQPCQILLCSSSEAGNASADWRAHLVNQGLSFQVIHAEEQGFMGPCLKALLHPDSVTGLSRQSVPIRWQGVCETCSDPACELRLFSGLLQSR